MVKKVYQESKSEKNECNEGLKSRIVSDISRPVGVIVCYLLLLLELTWISDDETWSLTK